MSRSDTMIAQAARMRGMSPRSADRLTPEMAERLRAAQRRAEAADAEFRREVRAALEHGSVRQVAAALGISPTTVQKWSKEEA